MAIRRAVAGAIAAILVFAIARLPLSAHEVPNDVLIQAFIATEGDHIRMAVRIPLIAMRDMTWPFTSADILDTSRAATELHNAATLWLGDESTMYEGQRALPSPTVVAVRATLPTDQSFESYEQAVRLLNGPQPSETDRISIREGFLDVLFDYPLASSASRLSFEPRWGRLGVRALTTIRVRLASGERRFELQGDPGLVRLDPTWTQATTRFLNDGITFALSRTDQLLFLLCLILPFRRLRELAVIVFAFIAAQSVTLLAAAYGLAPQALWFPSFIDTLVAASLLYVAVENIVGPTLRSRWLSAAAFGLAHGFAFAMALGPTRQFAGAHAMASYVSFNVGIEVGLLVVMALAIPVFAVFFRFVAAAPIGVIVLSALAAHAGWHWLTIRANILKQYQFIWPDMTPAFFLDVVRWLMVLVVAAALTWLVGMLRRPESSRVSPELTGRS